MKANYRTEMDALNAIIDEMRETNRLLREQEARPVPEKKPATQAAPRGRRKGIKT